MLRLLLAVLPAPMKVLRLDERTDPAPLTVTVPTPLPKLDPMVSWSVVNDAPLPTLRVPDPVNCPRTVSPAIVAVAPLSTLKAPVPSEPITRFPEPPPVALNCE